MLKLTNNISAVIDTSKMGDILLVYRDMIEAFGEPVKWDNYMISGEGVSEMVSNMRWVFEDNETGAVFTVYNYKRIAFYDPALSSVKELKSYSHPISFSIGSNRKGSLEEFKTLLTRHIHYIKSKEDKVDEILLGKAFPPIPKATSLYTSSFWEARKDTIHYVLCTMYYLIDRFLAAENMFPDPVLEDDNSPESLGPSYEERSSSLEEKLPLPQPENKEFIHGPD